MQHNYSSESETSGLSEDLLVLWQLAGGEHGKRDEQTLCSLYPIRFSNKLRVGLVKFSLEIKDTASI